MAARELLLAVLLILLQGDALAKKKNSTSSSKGSRKNHSHHKHHLVTDGPATAEGAASRLARSVGRMHLNMLQWYCVEFREAHSTTVPCENYGRLTRMVEAKTASERHAITKEFAHTHQSATKTPTEAADRARLVKQGYAAMQIAYCNVPAHKLLCANPDLEEEWKKLSKAQKVPAESLDQKAWTALTLNHKQQQQLARASNGGRHPHEDKYLKTRDSYAYSPPG